MRASSVTPGEGGGLVCKAYRLSYHSPLGLRVVKKKKEVVGKGPLPGEYGTYKTATARFWP